MNRTHGTQVPATITTRGESSLKNLTNQLRGIIFDMDGTIIDTERLWEEAIITVLKNNGAIASEERYHQELDKTAGRHLYDTTNLLLEAFKLLVTPAQFQKELVITTKGLMSKDINFIHGFEEFHRRVTDAKIPTSIATNCEIESLQVLIEKMRFIDFFGDQIFCIDHVENKAKPDPALFLHAAAQLKADPAECIVFEDSLAGFQAAKAAQISCIGINNKKNTSFIKDYTVGTIDTYTDADDAVKIIVQDIWGKR